MPADLLILKKRGQKFSVKITPQMRNRYSPANCDINVNMQNYKDVALFLQDLEIIWNVPIKRAIEEYQKNKTNSSQNPFW
jgi:hypothetical protein